MGPESAKSFPGQHVVRARPEAWPTEPTPPAEWAVQEADYGRRGTGYVFGAFQPANGEAFTGPYARRTTSNGVNFLEQVEAWLPTEVQQVFAIVDNLKVHRATDVMLFSLAHPRWAFVFQPKYAASLNLIEPWWKILRALALKGQRFETWEAIC
ncbi:MAG: transposase [Anaerolineales bacterium]